MYSRISSRLPVSASAIVGNPPSSAAPRGEHPFARRRYPVRSKKANICSKFFLTRTSVRAGMRECRTDVRPSKSLPRPCVGPSGESADGHRRGTRRRRPPSPSALRSNCPGRGRSCGWWSPTVTRSAGRSRTPLPGAPRPSGSPPRCRCAATAGPCAGSASAGRRPPWRRWVPSPSSRCRSPSLAGRPLAVHPAAAATAGGVRYVVQPGDTLWSIATRFDHGGDPRALVAQLAAQTGTEAVVPRRAAAPALSTAPSGGRAREG